MNLPRFAVERPVFTSMIALIVVVLGVVALVRLRIDMLPAVEVPTLTVSTRYEGADPLVVERQVTRIVEEILATVPGINELTSTSSEGRSRVRVRFAWGTDIDLAATDVRARLEEELSELPDDIERPQLRKYDIASFPVVILGIAADALDPVELNEIAERQIRNRFARLPGVAQVDLWGGYQREIQVELDPQRLQALGLVAQDIVDAIRAANVDLPAGSIREGRQELVLRAPAEIADLEELAALTVARRGAAVIRLDQVARVVDGHEELSRLVRVEGERGIRIAIRKEADANTVAVARAILDEIAATSHDWPQLRIVAIINQGNFIERSLANVARSVVYGGALALLILLFFLRSLRSTVVIGIAIPLSILATLALVYGGGLTLNLMTLGGLALGVGMMVDSSIVVLENIFRRRSEQEEPAAVAAERGSSEVAGAIIASTITTLVIFLPLAFVAGVAGLLFGELALVVVYALCASLVVSLSLVPMLAARMLRRPSGGQGSGQGSAIRRLLARAAHGQATLEAGYERWLQAVLHQRLLTIAVSGLLLAASLLLWPLIGSELMPPADEGEVRVGGEFEAGTPLAVVDRQARKLEAAVFAAVPEVQAAVTSVNASGRQGDAAAEANLRLNVGSAARRTRSNEAIADDLRAGLEGRIAGMELRVRAPQGQFLLDRLLGGDSGLQIRVRGDDLDRLEALARRAAALIAGVPGVNDVEDDIQERLPQRHLVIDRLRAADLGFSVAAVAEAIEAAMAGRQAGDFRPEGHSVPIRVRLAEAGDLAIDDVLDQRLRAPDGRLVPLRALVRHHASRGPAEIARRDQQRSLTLSVDTSGRDDGSIVADIDQILATIPLPPGYAFTIAGSYEEQQRSFHELVFSFVLALVLVYMVLACQYESLRDPLIVMSAVPVAAIGVLIALYISRSTMNVQSGIGCIMLGGIVVNNAILLVDQAGHLRRAGGRVDAAIAEAGRRRLRPILMTTATTVLGLLPLALGIGEGADAQAPLARAVVGGLIASTLITLFLVPAIYSLLHSDRASALPHQ